MPDTLAQAKSINDKAARSAARRRARLFYEKATRKVTRSNASATSTPLNTPELIALASELITLDQLKRQLRSGQEAPSRDSIELYNPSLRQPTYWFKNLIRFFCHPCWGLFLLYVSIILFYYSVIYLFNRSQ